MPIDELLDSEGAAVERNADAPLKPGTRVTRGHGRTKTLQVRLTDDEYEELERDAEGLGLPVSTLARQRLLATASRLGSGESGDGSAEKIAAGVFERLTPFLESMRRELIQLPEAL